MTACLVIGSGPAGIACADALLETGREVIMLDVGRQCEPERMKAAGTMSKQNPEDWDAKSLKFIGAGPGWISSSSRKLFYGSDFAYVGEESSGLVQDGARCALSWARGGLSNVWGAAMLPYAHDDTRDWPLRIGTLAPHYRAIAALTGLSGIHDGLDELFEADYPLAAPPDASTQARWLLRRLQANGDRLHKAGFRFGRSRLAIRGCKGCQLCFTGCPYDLIFRADHVLLRLQGNRKFKYCSDHLVDEIRHRKDDVSVVCRMPDGSRSEVTGARAFLAAGVIGTAKIVIRSLGLQRADFRMNYHPYFLMPVFLLKSVGRPDRERLHTLAQIFLEIKDGAISDRMIHLQLYTYNPLFRDRLVSMFGFAPMLSRFGAIQGYLHSSDAEPIYVHTSMNATTGKMTMALRGRLDRKAAAIIGKVRRKLTRHSRRLGFVPLPAMMQVGAPGDGNHIGGTFPMASDPGAHATDTLGRLNGYPRLHIVDASVLPSLAATTLTFTAMANARRIAVEAAALDADAP